MHVNSTRSFVEDWLSIMTPNEDGWGEALVDIIVDFTEAAVHTLLHARRVYPHAIFERRRKYGVPVWMSRHPDLNDYIYQVLLRTRTFMLAGLVRKLHICFFKPGGSGGQAPVERVTISISEGPAVPERTAPGGHQVGRRQTTARGPDRTGLQELEDQLRSALLQIEKSSAHLPTRHGCTFALHVQVLEAEGGDGTHSQEQKENGGASLVRAALREGDWLLADYDTQGVLAIRGRRQLVPIKSVQCPNLRLDLSADMEDCPMTSDV